MARAPISVVIPTLNSADELAACLATLSEGLNAGLIRELIVSDGGSSDATLTLAAKAGADVVHGPKSRGGQMGRGCAAAQGAWLLVLHADTQMCDGWSKAVLDHLKMSPSKAGYFTLQFRASGFFPRMVAGWAMARSRVFGLPYGDQGLLISRALYDQVGGYANIPLMEDVALARKLRGQLRRLNAVATTSAVKYQRQGWLKRGVLNLLLLVRYLFGADPRDLAREYTR